MKAIRIHQAGEPEVMKLEETHLPKPAEDEIAIKIHAAGVNPVDTYIRAGALGYGSQTPFTPGFDAAGIVEEVGAKVTLYSPGDRVYTFRTITGAYAEKALCKESHLFPLPENISFSQGAAMGVPYSTAYRALMLRGKAQPGEFLLVHGASGSVGTAAVQIASSIGMKIIGTASTRKASEMVKEQGASYILNHYEPKHFEEIMEITRGKGVDIIMEMLSNINLGKDLEILAKKGRVVVIGSRGTVEIDARNLMMRDADIRGISLLNATNEELKTIHSALYAGLKKGTLNPIIRKEMPLEEAPKAHHEVIESKAYGKIVLVP